jgi:hypothetical protein
MEGRGHQPQQRVRAGRHREPLGQPGPSLTAEGETEVTLQLSQALGPARRATGDLAQALGKGAARAGQARAAEPSCLNLDRHRPALPGQVVELAQVPAVDAPRRLPACRARRGLLTRARGDRDEVGRRHDLKNGQAGRNEGQQMLGQNTVRGL